MKRGAALFFIIAFILLTFVGVALAKEMSGKVTAVDLAKGTLTLSSGKVEVGFDCEEGSIAKDVNGG
ncbi:MAG: hypothetical protein ACHQ0Y_15280 [Thermodesulfovibrionales bacterium]